MTYMVSKQRKGFLTIGLLSSLNIFCFDTNPVSTQYLFFILFLDLLVWPIRVCYHFKLGEPHCLQNSLDGSTFEKCKYDSPGRSTSRKLVESLIKYFNLLTRSLMKSGERVANDSKLIVYGTINTSTGDSTYLYLQ